jgi:hypothetical protein
MRASCICYLQSGSLIQRLSQFISNFHPESFISWTYNILATSSCWQP